MTADTVDTRGRRIKPVQAIALTGCLVVFVMTAVALGNGLLGYAPWPARISTPEAAIHIGISFAALPLTVVQLARRKGDFLHRTIGYVWCALLFSGAVVSFFIHELTGGFSPPHVFAILTVVAIPTLVHAALTGRRARHRALVLTLAFTQIVAGSLTFIPERHSIGDLFWVIWS